MQVLAILMVLLMLGLAARSLWAHVSAPEHKYAGVVQGLETGQARTWMQNRTAVLGNQPLLIQGPGADTQYTMKVKVADGSIMEFSVGVQDWARVQEGDQVQVWVRNGCVTYLRVKKT